MTYRIRNWNKFQHYTKRNPPWLKLHRTLLDDPDYHALAPEPAKYLPLVWLIAAEKDGELPASELLAFRLRVSVEKVRSFLKAWEAWLSVEGEQGASEVLAECLQDATSESEAKQSRADITSGKPDPVHVEVIGYLNEKAGTNFRPGSKATQKLIKARLAEGATLEDFKAVIDDRCKAWLRDGDWVKYLRPATLFNASKFESYLGGRSKPDRGIPIRRSNVDLAEQHRRLAAERDER